MITKDQADKHVEIWKPIQLEIEKLIVIANKALERDSLIYVCSSPYSAIDSLEEADEILKDLIEGLSEYDEDEEW